LQGVFRICLVLRLKIIAVIISGMRKTQGMPNFVKVDGVRTRSEANVVKGIEIIGVDVDRLAVIEKKMRLVLILPEAPSGTVKS
jgi:hypothetical protein